MGVRALAKKSPPLQKGNPPKFPDKHPRLSRHKNNERDDATCWGIVQKHPHLAQSIVRRLRLDRLEGMEFEDAVQMVKLNLFRNAKKWNPEELSFKDFAWKHAKSAYRDAEREVLINTKSARRHVRQYWEWRTSDPSAPLSDFAEKMGVGIRRAKTIEDAAFASGPTGNRKSLNGITGNGKPLHDAPGPVSEIHPSALAKEAREEMGQTPEYSAGCAKFARALWASINRLPPNNREAVCRYFCLEGDPNKRTFAELSEELGVNKSTLINRVHRGVKRVRKQLSLLGLIGESEGIPSSVLADALLFIHKNEGTCRGWEKEFPAPKPRKRQRKKPNYPRNRKRKGAFRSVPEALELAEQNMDIISAMFGIYGDRILPHSVFEKEEGVDSLREFPEWAVHTAFFELFRAAAYWDGSGSFRDFASEKLVDAMHEIAYESFPDLFPKFNPRDTGVFLRKTSHIPKCNTEAGVRLQQINAETFMHTTDSIPLNPEELLIAKERQKVAFMVNFAVLGLTSKQQNIVRSVCGMRNEHGEEMEEQGYAEIARRRGSTTRQNIEFSWKKTLRTLSKNGLVAWIYSRALND
ncbi:sigma-70 family RNA polymerase sigma factor [Candidatus Micrarchaeota archaeon]|nr:sigma-70 family RNA polymerase sigma factor [Candidatus Micrarchaeota archaeon]